jgi:AcrR family transcriptional regulator
MPRPPSDKRERLTASAMFLTYTRGFDSTSIGDIADHAGVPAGSVYYYLKTKAEVGSAVLAALSGQWDARLEEWSRTPDARDRLLALVDHFESDAEMMSKFGCPTTTVCAQIARESEDFAAQAQAIVQTIVEWSAGQFRDLGFSETAASARATHLVAGLQGGAALGLALRSVQPIQQECEHLNRWVVSTKAG